MDQGLVLIKTEAGKAALLDMTLSAHERSVLIRVDGVTDVGNIIRSLSAQAKYQADVILLTLLRKGYIATKLEMRKVARENPVCSPQEIADLEILHVTADEVQLRAAADQRYTEEFARVESLNERYMCLNEQIADHAHHLREQLNVEILSGHEQQKIAQQEKLARHELEAELQAAKQQLDLLHSRVAPLAQASDERVKLHLVQRDEVALQPQRVGDETARFNTHYQQVRDLDFFRNMSDAEWVELFAISEWRNCKAGALIYDEGEAGMEFYVLISGRAHIYKRGKKINALNSGDVFGEHVFLSGDYPVKFARAVAKDDCEMLVIDPIKLGNCGMAFRLHVTEAFLRREVKKLLHMDERVSNSLADGGEKAA